ncbi:MAG: hypothetical protein HQM12_21060 [SAR324 cluster bacterium]|nr:hypothetical protein [SAR324 cluster bacterium]
MKESQKGRKYQSNELLQWTAREMRETLYSTTETPPVRAEIEEEENTFEDYGEDILGQEFEEGESEWEDYPMKLESWDAVTGDFDQFLKKQYPNIPEEQLALFWEHIQRLTQNDEKELEDWTKVNCPNIPNVHAWVEKFWQTYHQWSERTPRSTPSFATPSLFFQVQKNGAEEKVIPVPCSFEDMAEDISPIALAVIKNWQEHMRKLGWAILRSLHSKTLDDLFQKPEPLFDTAIQLVKSMKREGLVNTAYLAPCVSVWREKDLCMEYRGRYLRLDQLIQPDRLTAKDAEKIRVALTEHPNDEMKDVFVKAGVESDNLSQTLSRELGIHLKLKQNPSRNV